MLRQRWQVAALLLSLCAMPAAAQDGNSAPQDGNSAQLEMLRSSLERDQQSEAFGLRLQHQQQLEAAPVSEQPALEQRQLRQRQAFDNLSARQQSELCALQFGDAVIPAWGPRLERERRALLQDKP
mgnify:CR=1 FL=1